MAVKWEVVVVVIKCNHTHYKRLFCSCLVFLVSATLLGQTKAGTPLKNGKDKGYVKKVLDQIEVETLFSYYIQDGQNAAVTGGEGTEFLTDTSSTLVIRIPINENDVLSIDTGLSAYTSASSSNVNPFDQQNGVASPWVASSGASRADVLAYFNPSYTHSSEDRNTVYTASLAASQEYDYQSFGFGLGLAKLYNEKNTEISVQSKVYFDAHKPQYPIELRGGFFDNNIRGSGTYAPLFNGFSQLKRNTYALSLSFSQIISSRLQGAIFIDAVMQEGLLSSPLQRVYFADRQDFFVGDFQLADQVETLPFYRYKYPIGGRLNYYFNDWLMVRSYARYYMDSWGMQGLTAELELPITISPSFSLYPNYRFYKQTAADYFFEKEVATSQETFYTSDYDLSAFTSHQYGMGLRYKDIFASAKLWRIGLKAVDLRYSHYRRSNGLVANISSLGFLFVVD